MTRNKNSRYPNIKHTLWVGWLLLITIICATASVTGNEDFDLAKQQVMLRKIGHEVLLQSKDSTSRVLPVKKIADNTYQIRFENEFTFQPDSLVQIVKRTLALDPLSDDYIVNVISCSGGEVLFGYAISQKEQNSMVPCTGRQQPKGCYLINLTFQQKELTAIKQGYWIGGLSLFAFIGWLIVSPFRVRKRKIQEPYIDNDAFQIGNTLFDFTKRQITTSGISKELTPKENKLLRIFADAPNCVIERSRIQKEIWEDEGVIVGRSLDMFISKLRKKLENDPSVQIVNIHGKGYTLKIGDPSLETS